MNTWRPGNEIMKWRPEGFDAGKISAKVLQERGITSPQYWNSSVMCALVEAGADAVVYDPLQMLDHMSDSLQAKHMALADKPEEQLMICPEAETCETHHCNSWDGTASHWEPHTYRGATSCGVHGTCPACVPYVPEKWVDVTYEHLREKLGKYKYGLR